MMKNESGRSMVEMLGVLAIIGVLSVGGIAGYTMAMNKYRANEIAAAAAQCGIMAVAKATTGGGDVAANTACDTLMEIPSSAKDNISSMTVAAGTDGTSTVTVTAKDAKVNTALKGMAISSNNNGFTLKVGDVSAGGAAVGGA